ncbi:hypothetical protein [Mucilaginibacter sp.]|uniref:hypothetical protein n=1 Tax=Mucilaginibacter sp. TaxID=1882438 RepID=UPI0025CE215C|nr:hypothetical protein [Mucilaginibacter sp.]
METTVKNNGQAKAVNTVKEEKNNPQFVAGNPVNAVSAIAQAEKETPKKETEQPKAEAVKAVQPVTEQPKAAVKPEPAKPVLNLEGTLKLVEELHRRKVQRDKLLDTIQNLEAFEINQKDEAEENGVPNYSRCELTIEDDKGKSFATKNPVIIFHVAQYVNALCVDKLAQIEAGIIIPA